jgi:hypothetical protein
MHKYGLISGFICVEHSRQRILLWPSVLGISERRVVRRLELERTMGGCLTDARSGPDSSGASALLPSPPAEWREYRREAPPRWKEHYGREWREEAHERDWREGEERWARHDGKSCPPGLAKKGRC